MATIERAGPTQDILIVTGNDPSGQQIHGDGFTGRLRDTLNPATTQESPVRRGTHDFWIVYSAPDMGGGFHSSEDLSVAPRRMRGIVHMPTPNVGSVSSIASHLSVLLQEVGHHWLVPRDLKARVNGVETPVLDSADVLDAWYCDAPLSGPILRARGGIHWGSFFQGDGSPMDGAYWVESQRSGDEARWEFAPFESGLEVQVQGLSPVPLNTPYCDLDLVIMGVKTPQEAYPDHGGSVRWIEPFAASPMDYDMGLFVAFGPNDFATFGFHRDHRVLQVARTGRLPIHAHNLAQNLFPSASQKLRIIRSGNRYDFQVLNYRPALGCLAELFKKLGVVLFQRIDAKQFETVATLEEEAAPLALGFVTKTSCTMHAEGALWDTRLVTTDTEFVMPTDSVPAQISATTPWSEHAVGEFHSVRPDEDAFLRATSGEIRLVTPLQVRDASGNFRGAGPFDHTPTADGAPKVVTRAPSGDFSFTSQVRVHRAIFAPWSGGDAAGKLLWGRVRSLPISDIAIPNRIIQDEQPPPPDNTFKVAFIILAPTRADVSDELVNDVDTMRRCWARAFELATALRRHSDSRL